MAYKLQAILLLQYFMCSFHVSWLSIIIPKNFVDSFCSVSVSLNVQSDFGMFQFGK